CQPRVIIQQPYISITKANTGNQIARIRCQVKRDSSDSSFVHWYIQRQNKELRRLLYISDTKPVYDTGTDETKYDSDKKLDVYTLVIQKVIDEDAATYYCANWGWDKHTERIHSPACTNILKKI
ncbi:hypothetical protein GDO86_019119, partial [Hymenochirus boettgeri]